MWPTAAGDPRREESRGPCQGARHPRSESGSGASTTGCPRSFRAASSSASAVARAIAQQPRRDSFRRAPGSNVDAKLRRKVRSENPCLCQQDFGLTKRSTVTHDQEEALAVSDRIVVMDQGGRIAQVGTPEDLYERPASAFIANFIGDANLIEGRVAGGRFTTEGLDVPLPGADGPAFVSIRPERIALDVFEGGPARVAGATYLGSRMEYEVALGGTELLVSRPISEPRLETGQKRRALRMRTRGGVDPPFPERTIHDRRRSTRVFHRARLPDRPRTSRRPGPWPSSRAREALVNRGEGHSARTS